MRFGKIIAIIMAALLFATAFVACDKGEKNENGETAPVYYTVTFNTAGSEDIEPRSVKSGTTLTEPVQPARDGYVFEGWYNGTRQWDFSYTVKENMTLTAHWVTADTVFEHTLAADGENAVITGIKNGKSRDNIYLPTQIGGRPVTEVGEGAFSKLSAEVIQSITLPDCITVIGSNAFEGSTDIAITVKGDITYVGEKAFFGCTGLEEIKLGDGIVTVAAEAFSGTGLKTVVLPKTVKTVDENAFSECEALKILILHDTVETVKDMAFKGSGLQSVLLYGTAESFKTLIGEKLSGQNDEIVNAEKYIYSETQPVTDAPDGCKGFWHYNNKGEAKAW